MFIALKVTAFLVTLSAGFWLISYGVNEFGPIAHGWALVVGYISAFMSGFIARKLED